MSDIKSRGFDQGRDADFDQGYVNVGLDEKKHQLNTALRESVIEYLRAASFHEDEPITEIVERAVMKELNRMSEERGEQYEVYPTHEVR